MKKLATLVLIISFMSAQLNAKDVIATAQILHKQGLTLRAMQEKFGDQDSFNFKSAVEYIQEVQTELAWAGIETNLLTAAEEVIQVLANTGEFTAQELALAYQFYENFIMQNPEYAIPVKIPVGLIMMLAGVLICLAPGAQVIGAGLITTGSTLVIQGFAQWEEGIINSGN